MFLIRKAEENNNTYVIIIPMGEIWGTMGESGVEGCCIHMGALTLGNWDGKARGTL